MATLALVGCAPRLSVGTPCDRNEQCTEPLVCGLGRCRTECESHRDCPLGALCLFDNDRNGSCRLTEEETCTTASCGSNLMCIDGACANVCTVVADCPGNSRCEAGHDGLARCVRDDVPLADAGIEDVNAIDDAGTDAPSDGGAPDTGADGGISGRIVDVAVNQRASCALRADGAVFCWGLGSTSGLGRLATEVCSDAHPCATRPQPVQREVSGGSLVNLTGVTAIAANASTTCAVAGGQTLCWGDAYGPLGSSSIGEVARPVRSSGVLLPSTATAVAVADAVAFSDHPGSDDFMWGNALHGEFGLPAGSVPDAGPVAFSASPLPSGEHLSFGTSHGCGLQDGRVHCWGENDYGQSGALAAGEILYEEMEVADLPSGEFIDVAPGRAHTCGLLSIGEIWCWGDGELFPNRSAPLGCTNIGGFFSCPPRRIFTPPEVTAFRSLARTHLEAACAIDSNGGLWCWGTYGYLPDDVSGDNDPRPIAGLADVSRAAMGVYHMCAVAGGEVYCWGENELGQLGRGTFSTPSELFRTPVLVPIP